MRKYLYPSLIAILLFSSLFYLNYRQSLTLGKNTPEQVEKKDRKERDRPDLAAAQEIEMTKSPRLGYPPIHKKIQAFEETQRLLKKKNNAKAIASVEWIERGPNNVGGRTRAFFFDPNDPSGKKVWAGAVAGGIWYNNDITSETSEWQNVDDFMANIAISALAFDPQNTNVFYAGTGLLFTGDVRGAGIWKSEDSGATWQHLPSTNEDGDNSFTYVQKIIVTPSSKIVAATQSGIEVSEDGGVTWINKFDQTVTDLERASDGTFYASNYRGDVFKSTDDAENWENILSEDGFRVELAPAPTDPNVVYAVSEAQDGRNVGYLKRTTDGGATWEDLTMPMYYEGSSSGCSETEEDFSRGQSFFDLILAVYPTDPNSVIIGGIDLYRSTDAGTTWQLLSYWTGACADYVHADQHAITFKEGSGTTAIFGNDGGVFYSETLDADVPEFEERILEYNTALFYSCASSNEVLSNTYLAGAQDNGSHKFAKQGINTTTEVTGGDGAYCFIDQDNPNVMITSYVYNSYYRSLDGGQSFDRFINETTGRFINPTDYDDETDILYAANESNKLSVYENISGESVASSVKDVAIDGTISHLRVSPYKENRVFIGTGSGKVFIFDNANTNPVVKSIGTFEGYVSSIEIGADDNHLLVTLSNYEVVSVYETKDGGTTWVDKEGNLPDMPVRWALYNPANRNEVLLATEFGIWSTDNVSADVPEWEPTVTGLANVKCMMLQYRESDQQVVVATFGRGLFTTNVFTTKTYPDFAVDKSVAYLGNDVQFENHTVGKADDYLWDFGDGSSSTEKSPLHTYTTPGTYTVSLSVNSGKERIVRDSLINILPDREGDYSTAEGGDFDTYTGDFIPVNISGTPFELGSSAVAGKDGTASGNNAWVTGLDDDKYVNNSTALLYTPHFDLSAAGTYELSFKTKHQFESNWDGFIVQYTLDSGKTWTKLNDEQVEGWYNQISDPQSVFGVSVPIFSGSTDGFEVRKTDISALSGNGRVGFRFLFRSDAAEIDAGMALDDFQISGTKTDAIPDFAASPSSGSACEGALVTFEDKSTGSISSWSWNFGDGASPATATGRGPHVVTYSTTGLKSITLTVEGEINGTQISSKADFITITGNSISDKAVTVANSELCVNEGTTVSVQDTEAGFTYQLFDADDNPVSSAVEGNAGALQFETGSLSTTTSYYVQVQDKNSSCTLTLSQQPEVQVLPPTVRDVVVAIDKICNEESLTLTVKASETGASYSIFNLTTGETFSDAFEGTGEDLELASHPVTADAELQVIASSASCNIALEPFMIYVKEATAPVITADGATLSTTAVAEGFIEWFLDGESTGIFSNTIEARSFGEYTVALTVNGCTAVSEPLTATILSVEDLLEKGELKAFPNPTNGLLYVNQNGRFNSLRVYNMMGQVMITRSVIFRNEVLNLAELPAGQYVLELMGETEAVKLNIQKQ